MSSLRPACLLLLAAAGVACSESNDIVYTADQVVVWDGSAIAPTTEAVVPAGPVLIERIWSPEAAIAEVLGTGARLDDPITVDGQPADVVLFDIADGGLFTIRVRVAQEGTRTVCIRDECGRVFVVEPGSGSAT